MPMMVGMMVVPVRVMKTLLAHCLKSQRRFLYTKRRADVNGAEPTHRSESSPGSHAYRNPADEITTTYKSFLKVNEVPDSHSY
jgi:hypothetical protein